jgi:hypothetical protein
MVRIGSAMMGPLPAVMSKGMFMPVRGVRMSLNRMTPSGLNASHGCREISTCRCKVCTHFVANSIVMLKARLTAVHAKVSRVQHQSLLLCWVVMIQVSGQLRQRVVCCCQQAADVCICTAPCCVPGPQCIPADDCSCVYM